MHVIYNPSVPFEPALRDRLTPADWEIKAKFTVTFDLIKAYIYFAYFALAYTLLSHLHPEAFNVRLGVGTAFYFSITTIATVGYGDIVPASAGSRAMGGNRRLLGLVYVVLVFSVIAGHLQRAVRVAPDLHSGTRIALIRASICPNTGLHNT